MVKLTRKSLLYWNALTTFATYHLLRLVLWSEESRRALDRVVSARGEAIGKELYPEDEL